MDNRVGVKRRGKLKYYAAKIPLRLREPEEGRKEVMATTREELAVKYNREIEHRRQGLHRDAGKITLGEFFAEQFLPFYKDEVEPQTFHVPASVSGELHRPVVGEVRLEKIYNAGFGPIHRGSAGKSLRKDWKAAFRAKYRVHLFGSPEGPSIRC